MSYVHMSSPRKSYVPHTTYFGCNFRCYFCRESFFSKSKTTYFSAFFHKKYSKRTNNFDKIKETKCLMCTWNFLVHEESRIYHIRRSWAFGSPVKWRKYTYDYIALTIAMLAVRSCYHTRWRKTLKKKLTIIGTPV